MSNHDSNHSSTQRTILWTIIPATIFVSLLFTRLNHKMPEHHEALKSDYSQAKKSAPHVMEHEAIEVMPTDTTQMDTLHMHTAPAEAHGEHGTHESPKH